MKKVLFTLAAVAISAVVFDSCKKGEEDPFLSLRSRKARLVGEWKLSAGTETYVSGGATTTTTYTETQKTETAGSNSVTTGYTSTIKIEKDGSFSWTEVETVGSVVTTTTNEGTWNWVGRVGEAKNKEYVVFTVTKVTQASGSTTSTNSCTGGDCFTVTWRLKTLKNKELVANIDGTSTDSGGTDTTTGTMTYAQ